MVYLKAFKDIRFNEDKKREVKKKNTEENKEAGNDEKRRVL